MVKEFDLGEGSIFWLLMDLDKRVRAGDEVDNTEEAQVNVAAALAKRYLGEGWSVGLVANGKDRYFLPSEPGVGRLEQVLELLARVKGDGHTPLSRVLGGATPLLGPLSTIALITSSTDPDWPQVLESMLKRRIKALVILVDPTSYGSERDPFSTVQFLRSRGVLTYVVRRGDNLAEALDFRRTF
jgi:uncharacterized protein (DUF58 family)